jgi:hypothetical protein
MKKSLALVLTAMLACAAPALAGDGAISGDTLSAIGLSGMQTVSDSQGMEVRGQASAFAMTIGTSLVFGQLVTPDTKNFVVGSDVNMVQSNSETTEAGSLISASKSHLSTLNLQLAVVFPDLTTFVGGIVGSAGGTGIATAGN